MIEFSLNFRWFKCNITPIVTRIWLKLSDGLWEIFGEIHLFLARIHLWP